jgi:queuine tRNA-ribosyltransferase
MNTARVASGSPCRTHYPDAELQVTLDPEVVQTRSGAQAMRDKLTGELMHPVGPLVESERLYVEPSQLALRLQGAGAPLVLLDVGLGAASNALAAWRCSEALPGARRRLRIISLDRSLAALELALTPAHVGAFGLRASAGEAARALLAQGRHETSHTEWQLRLGEIEVNLRGSAEDLADIVFWDPFSPRANPELWTCAALTQVRAACRAGATLHTYSGATAVRSALLLAGFAVGMGAKLSEGKYATIAATSVDLLQQPLQRRWFERLSRSSAPFPHDAPSDALERIAGLAQFAG